MKINEVMKKYSITRKTLITYEEYELINPQRDDSGYRHYSQEDERKLSKIILLRKLNLSLKKIKEVLDEECDWVKETMEMYDQQIVEIEIKKDYVKYIDDVIHDKYDVIEAMHALNESTNSYDKHGNLLFKRIDHLHGHEISYLQRSYIAGIFISIVLECVVFVVYPQNELIAPIFISLGIVILIIAVIGLYKINDCFKKWIRTLIDFL